MILLVANKHGKHNSLLSVSYMKYIHVLLSTILKSTPFFWSHSKTLMKKPSIFIFTCSNTGTARVHEMNKLVIN